MSTGNLFFNGGRRSIIGGSPAISLLNDTINIILLSSSFAPGASPLTLLVYSDLGGCEIATGGGYTQGGITLGSKSIAIDTTNNRAYFTSSQVQWTSATITAAYACMLKKTSAGGSPPNSTDPLVGVYDFGGNKSSSNGNYTLQPDSTDGWLYLG